MKFLDYINRISCTYIMSAKVTSDEVENTIARGLWSIYDLEELKVLKDKSELGNSLRKSIASTINRELKATKVVNDALGKNSTLFNAYIGSEPSSFERFAKMINILSDANKMNRAFTAAFIDGIKASKGIFEKMNVEMPSYVQESEKRKLGDKLKGFANQIRGLDSKNRDGPTTTDDQRERMRKAFLGGAGGAGARSSGGRSTGGQRGTNPQYTGASDADLSQRFFNANIPGIGPVGPDGQIQRGIVQNAGGGTLDTEIRQRPQAVGTPGTSNFAGEGSDFVAVGPQSVNTAKKTYRLTLPIADAPNLETSQQDNLQSDALFEAFSWVPDGYGLGVENKLHALNRQNETLRYGMEQLFDPRPHVEYAHPRPLPPQFTDDVGPQSLIKEYTHKVRDIREKEKTTSALGKRPLDVMEDVYEQHASAKGLPFPRKAAWCRPVIVKSKTSFMPSIRPPELSTMSGNDSMLFTYQGI